MSSSTSSPEVALPTPLLLSLPFFGLGGLESIVGAGVAVSEKSAGRGLKWLIGFTILGRGETSSFLLIVGAVIGSILFQEIPKEFLKTRPPATEMSAMSS
jgi:hypothetical protein